jgi:hypothetical protein
VEVHTSRYDGVDFLHELERPRQNSGDPVSSHTRVQTYGPVGTPERQPVPVKVAQSTPTHRPTPDMQPTHRTYDDRDLEIPSFLRRPPQEERD